MHGLSKDDSYIKEKVAAATQPTFASRTMAGIVVLAGLAVLLALVASLLAPIKSTLAVDEDTYQVVFLADRQVFFGKLSNIHEPYVTLNEVYQVAGEEPLVEDELEELDIPQFSLERHSEQFYGPQDTIYIPRENIMFWNNLQPDGQIVQMIEGRN